MAQEVKQVDFLAKVIIVGDSGVGKTNLLTKYCDNCFQDHYVATVGVDFKLKVVEVEGTRIKLQLWDTAGQERFRNITQTYFKGASAVILAYEIGSRQTFKNINMWIRQIEMNNHDVCKVLIGTKIDLEDQRQVEVSEGRELAKRYGMIFEEVSAKSGINVEEVFELMSKEIKERRSSEMYLCKSQCKLNTITCSNNRCSC